MHRRLAALLLLCAFGRPLYAQVAQPRGVTVQRVAVRSSAESIVARRTSSDVSDGGGSSVWPWIGIGVVGGGVIGGGLMAVQVAHTDDAMMPGLAVGAGAVAGALLGGVIGALLYVVTRSAAAQ